MLTVAYYFLQVCLCSAVMMCYYALVLRNKRFHQYNRFYLLGVAILPWLVPLIKIEINKPVEAPTLPIQLFAVIADANSEFEKTVASKGFQLTWDTLAALVYVTVSAVFLVTLLVALVKIYTLLKQSGYKQLDDVFLVLTQANGTPFSFFKFIFWNTDVDVTTHTGKQMLQHELTHVQEKHSADKLLLQVVLIIGWFNPIFWLLKRELETIHEFIADNKTIANGDTATLATMLLTAAYPQQKFALTNPFFYSPIKRRIAMLANNKNPKFSYARRLVVLPLLVAITLLFAFRKKEDKPVIISVASAIENVVGSLSNNNPVTGRFSTNFNPVILNKTYTVVIDAGHGGNDFGALGIDGISTEKEIALSIARLVKASNINANINIVLTRDNDVYNSPPQKVEAANNSNPDLFISLHCNLKESVKQLNKNARDNPNEGIEIFIANKQKAKNYDANYNLAGALSSSLIKQNRADKGILTRQKGIWVLQAVNCPSALIECGYMDNKDDLQKLKKADFQQQLATNILKGIEAFLSNIEKGISTVVVDTVPKKIIITERGNTVFVTNSSKTNDATVINALDTISRIRIKIGDVTNDAIIIYNEKVITKPELDALYVTPSWGRDLYQYNSPSVFVKKYGEKARNGVIVINDSKPLIIVDGKKKPELKMDELNSSQIKSINVLKDKIAIDKYGAEGKNGVIEIFLNEAKPLYVVDGKKMPELKIDNISPSKIKSINVLKDKIAIDKYGAEGKNGVIEIFLNEAKPLYVVDGKKMPELKIDELNQALIQSINVLKGKTATDKYGDEGNNGVVEIIMKKVV